MELGLYIHIPFCLRKCNYCDFTSYPVKNDQLTAYLAALEQEMAFYQRSLAGKNLKITTLYIGGGTPTVLTSEQLRRLLETSRRFFPWTMDMEITVEANPGTISLEKLKILKSSGVNRLSIGVQSFASSHLAHMGRQHGRQEIEEGVGWARAAGFENISLDLIYGLPEQTLAEWKDTLAQALFLEPEHLSTYGLQVEAGTPWGDLLDKGKLELPGEDLTRQMYDEIQYRCVERGYQHYEISNFAKPGYEGQHSSSYWLGKPYLGLGIAAASFLFDTRWVNVDNFEAYGTGLASGQPPIKEKISLSREELMSETLFLGLRLLAGVSLEGFYHRYGVRLTDVFSQELDNLMDKGLVTIEDGHLSLTPFGLPIANEVFQAFL